MNSRHNIRTNNASKTSTLVKLSLALIASVILLTVSMMLTSHPSQAALAHINAQQELVTVVKINEQKSLDLSIRTDEHTSAVVPVSLTVQKTLAVTRSTTTTSTAITPAASDTASIIRQVFGRYAAQAIAIARCESSMNPNATNSYAIGNSHAAGLFQILYPSTWYGTSEAKASPYNALANTEAAHEIFVRDGYSWREWQCRS